MRVDLNADVAEAPEDLVLLDVVTSANVCCGAYAGGEELMLDACLRAAERGVVVGAQVGYRDPDGFGRRPQDPGSGELVAELRRQIDLLAVVADAAGTRIAYVKPHGALYNTVVADQRQAAAVVEAVAPYGLPLLGLPTSVALARARAEGLPVATEGFADRAYTSAGTLVPRSEPGAVLSDPDTVTAQATRLLTVVDSICVHGDTPGALRLARAVRAGLEAAGARLGPFA